MNCRKIKKYLPLYPEDLESGIRVEIEEHLQHCSGCKAILENLARYRSWAGNAREPEMPGGFEAKVIKKLEIEQKLNRNRQFYMKIAWMASSTAALILLFILFGPRNKPWDNAIETSFALKAEKNGKGPSELIDFNKIEKRISLIISETGSNIEKKEKNRETGYLDYIIVGVPHENLQAFILKFNEASELPVNIPETENENTSVSYFKIYFDMINFTTGNFDGDGYSDLIVQFISGIHKGKWVIYLNKDSLHYVDYHRLNFGKDETEYLGDHWILAGDFNGDSLDDVFLYEYSKSRGVSAHMLLNADRFNFIEAPVDFMKLFPAEKGEFTKIIPGDADGDGRDDLLNISVTGKDTFEISSLTSEMTFKPIYIPDLSSGAGIITGGDMNGDHYVDLCVKYMDGERAGQTWIYLNTRQGGFSEPYYGGLSWAGDYIFLTGDFNGDGLDDLFVKSGGPFFSGEWYVMRNQESGGLIFELQFQIEFPGD